MELEADVLDPGGFLGADAGQEVLVCRRIPALKMACFGCEAEGVRGVEELEAFGADFAAGAEDAGLVVGGMSD